MLIEYNGPTVSGFGANVLHSPLAQLEVDVDFATGELFDQGTPPLNGRLSTHSSTGISEDEGEGDGACKWFNKNSTTPSGLPTPCDPANNT